MHELGHARRVRAVGGVSRWETGDVNWWAYLQHRDPLAAGATNWLIPIRTSLDQKIAILAGGFNATTAWDEAVAGRGPLDLVTARYSTLFYELAGVNRGDDDLSQLQKLYLDKGYKISRREMQLWQLAAGCLTQFGGKVRAYAYYTPEGVSVKTVTTWDDWILSAETVVHGTSTLETEVGRRLCLNRHMMIMPKILFSEHGVGGEMAVDLTFGRLAASVFLQKVCAGSLQSWRASTSANLQVAVAM